MKIFLLLLFLCFSLFAQAEELTVGQVSVQTTRMNPHVVKNKFPLKSGDVFSGQFFKDIAFVLAHGLGVEFGH